MYLVLTPDIPDSKANVLVFDSLHVEPYCGNGGDDLSELQLVEDGGLTSCIETDHKDPHLLLGEEAAEELREGEPHVATAVKAVNQQLSA
jgi:hypothetical protein